MSDLPWKSGAYSIDLHFKIAVIRLGALSTMITKLLVFTLSRSDQPVRLAHKRRGNRAAHQISRAARTPSQTI